MSKPIKSFSPSRYSDYAHCGKKYQLTRIHRMPEHEAWFFVGGTAVHLATEMYDKGAGKDLAGIWEHAFNLTYDEAFAKDPDEDDWRTAKGYSGRGIPERWAEWNEKGLTALTDYVAWRKNHKMWEVIGVEEELKGTMPSGAAFHGFVDRRFQTPQGQVIVDLKTGSRQPDSLFQLGAYATYYELSGMERPARGMYWMSKAGAIQKEPVSLDNYAVSVVDQFSKMMWDGIENNVFLPIQSGLCFSCSARDACFIVSGDTPASRLYDPLNPNFEGA